MADYTVKKITELDTLSGFLDGIEMRQVRQDLGIESFGVSIIEMEPNASEAPEHDHSSEGTGGEMFARFPAQLEQEELYLALTGSGTVTLDGTDHEIDPDTVIHIGPAVTRKVVAGPDGLRLLAVGGVPGRAYGADA